MRKAILIVSLLMTAPAMAQVADIPATAKSPESADMAKALKLCQSKEAFGAHPNPKVMTPVVSYAPGWEMCVDLTKKFNETVRRQKEKQDQDFINGLLKN